MIVTPQNHGIELAKAAPGYVRSPGLHMSTVYNSLYSALEPERYGGTGEPDPLKLELGMAFEERLERGVKAQWGGSRPGEFTTAEGIIYSPDWISFEDGRLVVGEFKLTWQSSRAVPREPATTFPPRMSKWLTQIKAYAFHLETCYARLYVLFVNGTYSKEDGMNPELLCWDLVFTQRDLEDNWQGLCNHARHVGLLP